MDGWESRRRRVPGHDWCIVQLGMRGIVQGVNVDTSHFTGNYPSHCSIEAVDMPAGIKPSLHAVDGAPWTTLLEKTALRGNGENLLPISNRRPWTHLRLSIYPDGGVARLRVYGEVAVDWPAVGTRVVDLALITNGGLFLAASDLHYGTRGALIMPGRATNMGERWETRRRRGPGHDWAIIGSARRVRFRKSRSTRITSRATIQTAPRSRALAPNVILGNLAGMNWTTILPETKMSANKRHFYSGKQLHASGPFSHVRLNMFPDGGISRLRVHGTLARE
jgi:allantoicase